MKAKQVEVVRDVNVHSVRWVPTDLDVRVGSRLRDKLGREWEVILDYDKLEWTPPKDMKKIVRNAWKVI